MDTHTQHIIPISPKEYKPEEYIRTFERDMETLKKGGIPDLAPLVKTPSPVTANPLATESPMTPIIPIQTPLLVQQKIKIAPPPPPPAPLPILKPKPPPTPPPPPPPPPPVIPLETYANDFSEKMKETHASTATVLAAEQDSLKAVPKTVPQKSSRSNLLYSIAGVMLLIAGIAGSYVAYTHYAAISAPITLAPHVSAPIFVDESEQISGEGAVLLQAIGESINRPIATGAVRLLYSTSTTTTDSIFSLLHTPAPDILLRNTQAAGSMAGIVFTGGEFTPDGQADTQSPFFILSVLSYSGTFAGMLSWENALPRDLGMLFPAYSLSSTTPVSNKQSGFRDEVISNHDVRIYRDTAGKSIMLYGYWNQRTLVLARDPLAFNEILQRLATSRAQY